MPTDIHSQGCGSNTASNIMVERQTADTLLCLITCNLNSQLAFSTSTRTLLFMITYKCFNVPHIDIGCIHHAVTGAWKSQVDHMDATHYIVV